MKRTDSSSYLDIRHPDGPVLVIGAAGMDIVGILKAGLEPGTSNPADIRTSFGGVARNVAENLARLGSPVKLLTAIGDDSRGGRLLRSAAEAGIDVGQVLSLPGRSTASYLAVVNTTGDLCFALDDMGIIQEISPGYIRAHAGCFAEAALLFIDANLSKETLRTVMSLARRFHLPVCADPTSVSLAGRLGPYLSRLSLITPNSAEAGILCAACLRESSVRQALKAAKSLVSQGVTIAVITLAEFGVCYATSETSGHISALRTEIQDPTGAGDALTAAVIFALLNDLSLDDAIRLGVSAASLTLSQRGTVAEDLSLEKLYDRLVI